MDWEAALSYNRPHGSYVVFFYTTVKFVPRIDPLKKYWVVRVRLLVGELKNFKMDRSMVRIYHGNKKTKRSRVKLHKVT